MSKNDVSINFKVSIPEKEELQKRAKAAGCESLSEYVRKALLSYEDLKKLKLNQDTKPQKHAGGRPKKHESETENAIIESYKTGKTIYAVSKEFGLPYSTVYKICKR